jgi:hypothetical protein
VAEHGEVEHYPPHVPHGGHDVKGMPGLGVAISN